MRNTRDDQAEIMSTTTPTSLRADLDHRRPLRAVVTLLASVGLLLSACAAPVGPVLDVSPPNPGPASRSGLVAADASAWLDGLMPAALDNDGIAGASVVVVKDGRILLSRGYGRANTGTGDAPARDVDPDTTLFRVGSVSKAFTATAAMQLVERGRIDLDADVNRYLDFTLPEPKGTITVRTLLSHSAGFEERARPGIEPPGSTLDLRDFVATDPPEQVFVPGTVPAYSNYGNSLVGYIVQRVSGVPFATYVDQHVLARGGMTHSSFAQPLPADLAPLMSAGCRDDSQPAVPFELVGAAPAGALSASGTDMGRFLLAQLGDLPAGQELLEPDTLALMHRPALGADTLGALAQGRRMTLGLFDDSRNGHTVLGHDGDTQVFHSAFEIYPDDDAGVYVALNSSGRTPAAATNLRHAVLHGFSDRYFPAPAGSQPSPQPSTNGHAALAAGTYQTSRAFRSTFLTTVNLTGELHVAAQPDGTIVISPRPNGFVPARYAEAAPWVWREVGGSDVLAMRVVDGRVVDGRVPEGAPA